MSRSADAPPVLAIGTRVAGRYVVLRLLGQGGMGQVFEVEHDAIGRRFALKILNLNPCTDEVLRRFQREARALGKVTTPRVAQVSDFGVEPGVGPYYVMELLDGETLEDRLEREIRLPVAQAVALAVELAEALHEVHAAGIVHRDLKPSNVGLCRAGAVRVKLLDFGLAAAADGAFLERITRSQEVVGSLPYMAPERFHNAPPSPAVDLYALGVVLYETLTGRLPYDGESAAGIIAAHLNAVPPRLAEAAPGLMIPPAVEAVVGRLLAKDPQDRFVSALAAARALGAAALDPSTPTIDESHAESIAPTFYAPQVEEGGRTIEDPRPPSAGTSPGPFGVDAPGGATLPAVPATYLLSGPVSQPTSLSSALPVHDTGAAPLPATLYAEPAVRPSAFSHGAAWTTGQAVPPATLSPAPPRASAGRSPLLIALAVGAGLLAAVLAGVIVALVATDQGPPASATAPAPVAPAPVEAPAAAVAPAHVTPAPAPLPAAATAATLPPATTPAAADTGAPPPLAAADSGVRSPEAAPDAGARPVATSDQPSPPVGRERPPVRPRPVLPPPEPPPRPVVPTFPPRRPPSGIWDGGVIVE